MSASTGSQSQAGPEGSATHAAAVLPVHVLAADDALPADAIEVRRPDGTCIRMGAEADVSRLRTILDALEGPAHV
jgi:hypothetical protein